MSATDELFSAALLVEDEESLVVSLKVALRKLGIPSRHAPTLADARARIAEEQPDFILLDRNLPDGDGLKLCRELRASNFGGTILLLTALGQTIERVEGLDAGADDYLPKPFEWAELEARIKALSRRRVITGRATPSGWRLDASKLTVSSPRASVQLTPLEFKLASRLIQAAGGIVTRDELLKDVWGFTLLPKTRTVDHFMGRLRKHFEQNAERPRHFLTVRGAGYRFEP